MNFWGIAVNGLWILGLAVLLAVLSWANWAAGTQRIRFRAVLGRPNVQQRLVLGLFLLCMGLAATGRAWWERALWGFLAAVFVVSAWLAGRSRVAS